MKYRNRIVELLALVLLLPPSAMAQFGTDDARRSAENYLSFMAFSRAGLIDQLVFEGFTVDEARYGANVAYGNDVGLEPSASGGEGQAERSAQSYLTFAPFSRDGLIQQLIFEGFTRAEAQAGVDGLNVDWNEQAVRKARSYLSFMPFSQQGLIDQLVFEGFTHAQASHAVQQVAR